MPMTTTPSVAIAMPTDLPPGISIFGSYAAAAARPSAPFALIPMIAAESITAIISAMYRAFLSFPIFFHSLREALAFASFILPRRECGILPKALRFDNFSQPRAGIGALSPVAGSFFHSFHDFNPIHRQIYLFSQKNGCESSEKSL